MCKQKWKAWYMKGWRLEELYDSLESTKDILSILEPELEEKALCARIFDEEITDEALDIIQDSWNEHLAAKKRIFWKQLYELDVASRNPKKQEEETDLLQAVEQEKNPGLLKLLKDMEDRLSANMNEEFGKVNLEVKNLAEKLKFLSKKVEDLEIEVRGGNDCDIFERALSVEVDVRGEKSGNKEKGTEHKEKGTEEKEGPGFDVVADVDEQNKKEANEEEEEKDKDAAEKEKDKDAAEEEKDKDAAEEEHPETALVIFNGVVYVPPVVLEVEEDKGKEKEKGKTNEEEDEPQQEKGKEEGRQNKAYGNETEDEAEEKERSV